ncbi:MAG: hypothetical protein ACRDQ1_19650, partial [Sciscionella sp.]
MDADERPHATARTAGNDRAGHEREESQMMRHFGRDLGIAVGILALAGTTAACGSGGGGSSQNTDVQKLASMSTAQLADAAAKEGSLTWYTTFSDKDVPSTIKAFNKQYPKVKVNALRLSADKIPPRIITEQRGGKFSADVVTGDSPQVAQLIAAGALQAY